MSHPRQPGACSKGATMESTRFRILAMALTFALLAAPAAAVAQTPTREGNIWGWRDHQPTMAQTRQSEEAAGVAPTAELAALCSGVGATPAASSLCRVCAMVGWWSRQPHMLPSRVGVWATAAAGAASSANVSAIANMRNRVLSMVAPFEQAPG